MRPIIILLLVCFVVVVRADDERESAKANLVIAIKSLQETAEKKSQSDARAKKLKATVSAGLLEFKDQVDFSDEVLRNLDADIRSWKLAADELVKRNKEFATGPLVTNINAVSDANTRYQAYLQSQSDTPGTGANVPDTPDTARKLVKGSVSGWDRFNTWLLYGNVGLTVLTFGLALVTLILLRKNYQRLRDSQVLDHQSLNSLRIKQDSITGQFETVKVASTDLFARLTELSTDIGALSNRLNVLERKSPQSIVTSEPDVAPERPAEVPAFPIAADAYLQKMRHHATVVRPDFQNGILVADADNRGELVLVQDESIATDALFIIPRATQFQMKQDFFTYYERYYDCERPASGTVWIVDPAVVESVQGGWLLREKGVLEVR